MQRRLQEKATNISCPQSPQRTWAKPWCRSPHFTKAATESLDDRPPETILGLITLLVNLLEGGEMLVHHAPQVRCLRVAWAVERQRLGRCGRHERKRPGPSGSERTITRTQVQIPSSERCMERMQLARPSAVASRSATDTAVHHRGKLVQQVWN